MNSSSFVRLVDIVHVYASQILYLVKFFHSQFSVVDSSSSEKKNFGHNKLKLGNKLHTSILLSYNEVHECMHASTLCRLASINKKYR